MMVGRKWKVSITIISIIGKSELKERCKDPLLIVPGYISLPWVGTLINWPVGSLLIENFTMLLQGGPRERPWDPLSIHGANSFERKSFGSEGKLYR